MPTVSIVIPAYNAEQFVGEAINAVLSQTYADYEVVVVDDGSTDETRAIVKTFGESVRYYYQPNGGSASARNLGVEKSRGDYIAFLDADDLWESEKLEIQLDFLRNNPEIALVCSAYHYFGKKSKTSHLLSSKDAQGFLFRRLFLESFIRTSSVILKKSAFLEVGGFNEVYRLGQDYDLWLRIAKKYPIAYLGRFLVKARSHDQNTSKAKIPLRQNTLQMIKDHYDPRYISKSDYNKRLSDLNIYLGRNYLKKGAKQEAQTCFKEALTLKPFRPRTWRYLLKTWM